MAAPSPSTTTNMTNTDTPIPITKQQQSILSYLFRFRFLTRIHIQSILKHKHPGQINKWLKYLSENKIVFKIYNKTFPENSKPAIYCLNNKSVSILNIDSKLSLEIIKRIYGDKKRSKRFINHCLIIADIFIQVTRQCKKNDTKLFYYSKADLLEYKFLIKPSPDIYIAIESEDRTSRYFIDIVDDDTPRFALRHRIESLVEYFEGGQWQENTSFPFPITLFICKNDVLNRYLDKYIALTLENEGDLKIIIKALESLPLL